MPERDGHRIELAPALGHQRLGALRQLGSQPIELPHFFQECSVGIDADRERRAGGADVRRIGEDFRHAENPILCVVVADAELAVAQRHAGVEGRGERHLAGIQRHRQGQRLEGRAHFINAGRKPVDAGGIDRLARIVGVVIGERDERDHLAGAHVSEEARRGLGVEFLLARDELVAQSMLHAQIER